MACNKSLAGRAESFSFKFFSGSPCALGKASNALRMPFATTVSASDRCMAQAVACKEQHEPKRQEIPVSRVKNLPARLKLFPSPCKFYISNLEMYISNLKIYISKLETYIFSLNM